MGLDLISKSFEKVLANWLLNDFKGRLAKHNLTIENCGITPEEFSSLIWLHYVEFYSRDEVRGLLERRLAETLANY